MRLAPPSAFGRENIYEVSENGSAIVLPFHSDLAIIVFLLCRKRKGVEKMEIGVSSYSFGKYRKNTGCDLFKVCELAKQIGFSGIEFVNLTEGPCGSVEELELAVRLREHCSLLGLKIIAYTVGANLLAEDGESEIKKAKACLDVTQALGAPLMRHDVCYSLPICSGYTWRDALETIVPRVREITRYAAEKGIRTCSENHGYIFQDAERVETLIRDVDDANYGWLVDLGNFICADGDLLSSVRRAAPYAFHVHAKDFLWKSGREPKPEGWGTSACGNYWRGTVVGHGIVPIRQDLRTLKNAGYNGYVSLEFEGWEENLQALEVGYRYLKEAVAEIGG